MASQSPPPAAPSASMKTTALAPGFRFHPTDEELVIYYLKRKVFNKPVRFSAISEVDIYKNEPWDLADKAMLTSRDQEWYYYSALDRKYGNGARMNRSTNKGYWKATGKDREVRQGSQIIAMKKTLVFHSGRAPGGQRTNWVMHEYRLLDEELERLGGTQTDSYVLCRVFHKNNIGPPNGNRYAPFIEEEWDDGENTFIPGGDAYNGNCSERNCGGQDYNHSTNLNINEVPKDSENLDGENSVTCKTERDDSCPCVLNTEAPFPILQYKRRKPNNRSNASDNSTQDHTSSTTTAISALLEFSLMPRERPPRKLDVWSGHSSCMKYIDYLQSEICKISAGRETLKLEIMSAHAMMDILQSRVHFLNKENEDLKKKHGSL